jgi:hypothetical protein
MEIYNAIIEYVNFKYPEEYKKVMELDLVNYDNWYMMDKGQIGRRIEGLKKRYPSRKYIPFARRDDCDDIACFEDGMSDKVYIVHDFSSEGYELRQQYEHFRMWFYEVVQRAIEDE